jgi:hypothetical protein
VALAVQAEAAVVFTREPQVPELVFLVTTVALVIAVGPVAAANAQAAAAVVLEPLVVCASAQLLALVALVLLPQ